MLEIIEEIKKKGKLKSLMVLIAQIKSNKNMLGVMIREKEMTICLSIKVK